VKKPNLTDAKPWTVWRNPHGVQTLIGYARVSTRDQNLDVQMLRLREEKCGRIYAEKVSGANGPRPGWEALLAELRAGDTLLVLRIDRMGRRLNELVKSLDTVREAGAHVRSLEEGIDTSQRGGRFAFNVIASLAEKVRDDISENTRAGLAAAKLRGKVLGRPRKLEPARAAHCAQLRAQGFTLREIGRAMGIGKTTVQRALAMASALRGDPRQMSLAALES